MAHEIVKRLATRLEQARGDGQQWREALLETATRLDFIGVALWIPGEDGKLRNAMFASTHDMTLFAEQSRTLTFAPGEGMPGRTWVQGTPEWIPNVIRDDNFPRLRGAIRDLVRAVVAFPIVIEGKPAAVLEFFSRRILQPDPTTTGILAELGTMIGHWYPRLQVGAAEV